MVGSVITFLVANGITKGVSKGDVTMMAMASEHRMGLRTGGMDVSVPASTPTGVADVHHSKRLRRLRCPTPSCTYPSSPLYLPCPYRCRRVLPW